MEKLEVKGNKGNDSNKKPRATNPRIKVTQAAMKMFRAQLTQDTDTKRACLDAVVGKFYDDTQLFWNDFIHETRTLLNSVAFLRDCDTLGLDPQAQAEHWVCDKASVRKEIIANGLKGREETAMMYHTRLYLDPHNLHSKAVADRAKVPAVKPIAEVATAEDAKTEQVPA